MSDNSNKDSAEVKGTAGAATPGGSDSTSGQRGSEQEFVTVAQFEALKGLLDNIQRTVQGDKDRAVKKVSSRLESLETDIRTMLQSAQKEGRTIEDLLHRIDEDEEKKFRETILQMGQAFQNGQFVGGVSDGKPNPKTVDVSAILKQLELDVTDPRVAEFAARQFTSEAEATLEGAKLVKKILTNQPSDADVPSPSSARVRNASNQEALMAEYNEGAKNLYGHRLIEFKMQMRKKGLNIS